MRRGPPRAFAGRQTGCSSQALPDVDRAAAQGYSFHLRINPSISPRTPRVTKAPRSSGITLRPRGQAIAFSHAGGWWHPLQPVDCTLCNYVSLGSTKATARFATFQFPQVGVFFPQVGSIHPQASFSALGPISLSLIHFSEEEERKRGLKHRNSASTGCPRVVFWHPRIGCLKNGHSVDGFGTQVYMNQWVTCRSPDFPHPREKMLVPPCGRSRKGGLNGC